MALLGIPSGANISRKYPITPFMKVKVTLGTTTKLNWARWLPVVGVPTCSILPTCSLL